MKFYLDKIKNKKETARIRRVLNFKADNKDKQWKNLKSMALFLCFVLLDITIILMQMRISSNHSARLEDFITNRKFNPDLGIVEGSNIDNNRVPEITVKHTDLTFLIKQWVSMVYIPMVYNNNEFTIMFHKYVFNIPRLRASIRKKDYANHKGKKEYTEPIETDGLNIHYTLPGDEASPLHKGGYVFKYSNTLAEAEAENPVSNNAYISFNWYELIIEFLYFVPNTKEDYYGIAYAQFTRSPAGTIVSHIYNYSGRSFYMRAVDKFRAFLEIIWLFLQTWYIYTLIKCLLKHYRIEVKKSKKEAQRKMRKRMKKNKNKLNKPDEKERIVLTKLDYFGIRFEDNFGDQTFLVALVNFIVKVIIGIIRMITWTFKAVFSYSFEEVSNFLKVVSSILGLISIYYWINVVTQDSFDIHSDGAAPGAYESIFMQTKYIYLYNGIATSRVLLSSLLLMSYFEFSAKLSMFYEVIKSAMLDIVFFICIFFFYITAFALIAHL